jgi:hypothetical protein
MHATKTLPDGFEAKGTLDLSRNKPALIVMNILAFAALFGFGWLFLRAAIWLRPDIDWGAIQGEISGLTGLFKIILVLVFETIAIILFHEATHGLFFWIFSRERPHFGLRGTYAFASAPEWYFPRAQYMVIGLAPLVVLSLVGLILIALLPVDWIAYLLLFLIFNASGATGDILTIAWLLTRPKNTLARDVGDAITWYENNTP